MPTCSEIHPELKSLSDFRKALVLGNGRLVSDRTVANMIARGELVIVKIGPATFVDVPATLKRARRAKDELQTA